MKFDFRHAAMLLALGACFTSCSDDDDVTPADNRIIVTLGFENSGVLHAGPTSYGANLYYGYTEGTQFTGADFPVTGETSLHIGVNESIWTGEIDFYGGGMAVSGWNYRSNPADQTIADWWYSYQNQCSVYNIDSRDGANNGAGAGGSNFFLLAFGYSDNNSMSACSTMHFTKKAEYELVSVALCNSSYVYGTMTNGNPYGSTPDKNLEEAEGWFKVEFYGYDAAGNKTNGGNPVEFYLADYRPLSSTYTKAIDTWTECDLSALGKVNKVEINFKGSDVGDYGLNTPAYVCLDNLKVNIGTAN